jgi:hypothetical protein
MKKKIMKKEYCKVTIDGTFCIYNDLKEALSALQYDVEEFLETGGGSPVEVTFETVMMTDEEFAALPEFNGY